MAAGIGAGQRAVRIANDAAYRRAVVHLPAWLVLAHARTAVAAFRAVRSG